MNKAIVLMAALKYSKKINDRLFNITSAGHHLAFCIAL